MLIDIIVVAFNVVLIAIMVTCFACAIEFVLKAIYCFTNIDNLFFNEDSLDNWIAYSLDAIIYLFSFLGALCMLVIYVYTM